MSAGLAGQHPRAHSGSRPEPASPAAGPPSAPAAAAPAPAAARWAQALLQRTPPPAGARLAAALQTLPARLQQQAPRCAHCCGPWRGSTALTTRAARAGGGWCRCAGAQAGTGPSPAMGSGREWRQVVSRQAGAGCRLRLLACPLHSSTHTLLTSTAANARVVLPYCCHCWRIHSRWRRACMAALGRLRAPVGGGGLRGVSARVLPSLPLAPCRHCLWRIIGCSERGAVRL